MSNGKDMHRKENKAHSTENPIVQYINDHSLRLEPVQKKLIETTLKHARAHMLSSPDEIQLLQNLCRLISAKKALDIGVYTGYSALSIAMILPPDGVVVACDTDEAVVNVGKPFWKEAGVFDKIDLRIAPAKQTLTALVENGESGTFDFAFIDANKEGYDDYYELSLKLIRPGGIIAVDNMLAFGGHVIDKSCTSSDVESIRALNRKMAADQRIHVSFLNIGDGTQIAFKK